MNKKSIAAIIAVVVVGVAITLVASYSATSNGTESTENVEEISVEENLETATEVADEGEGRQFSISLQDGITASSNP